MITCPPPGPGPLVTLSLSTSTNISGEEANRYSMGHTVYLSQILTFRSCNLNLIKILTFLLDLVTYIRLPGLSSAPP